MSNQPVVIVTGGAGAIGSGLCSLFAKDGWAVVVADLRSADAEAVAAGLVAGGATAIGVGVDITDVAGTAAMAQTAFDRFGRIDALINNAGLFGSPMWTGPMLETDEEQWDAVMKVNVWGVVACVRAVAPLMKQANFGRIVNVSSQGAYKPAGVYSASKLAVHQVTWNLARELGDFGITVNAVGPGLMNVRTSLADKGGPEQVKAALSNYIVKRLGEPADLYAAMKYFISEQASWCTGQWLLVNGGSEVHL